MGGIRIRGVSRDINAAGPERIEAISTDTTVCRLLLLLILMLAVVAVVMVALVRQ